MEHPLQDNRRYFIGGASGKPGKPGSSKPAHCAARGNDGLGTEVGRVVKASSFRT